LGQIRANCLIEWFAALSGIREESRKGECEMSTPEECVILDIPEGLRRLNLLGLIVEIDRSGSSLTGPACSAASWRP
jgi:hypothetical protein